jgi:hypothetical protein
MEMVDAVRNNVLLSYVEDAIEDDDFTFGNKILYDLCKEDRSHNDLQIVIAKIWLIGRGYAAAMERGRNNTDEINNDQFYQQAAKKIKKSEIHKWLSGLDGLASVASGNIFSILSVFSKVEKLFSDIAGRGRTSLASKYLHFHFPNLFYICDTRAKKGMSKINQGYRVVKERLEIGNEHEKFFHKCFDLQEVIRTVHNRILTPRQLDRLLLRFYAEHIAGV